MARPKFHIRPQILRSLRQERGLTQSVMADLLVKQRGISQSPEAAKSVLQRIERKGETSRKMAEAIARILDCTIEQLQGDAQLDRNASIRRLEAQLIEEQRNTQNLALQNAIASEADADDPIHELSTKLAYRIESAQLSRNPSRLAELSSLTGLSEAELMAPACMDGLWFAVKSKWDSPVTEVVQGIGQIPWLVREVLNELPNGLGSDSRLRIKRDGHWYRLETQIENYPFSPSIDIVKCSVNDRGLRWEKPTEIDDEYLRETLSDLAKEFFNCLQLFDEAPSPTIISKLSILVTELDVGTGKVLNETALATNFSEEVFQRAVTQQYGFEAMISHLGHCLHDHIRTFLPELPPSYWDIRVMQNHIVLEALPPFDGWTRVFPIAQSYRVQLCELLDDGGYRLLHLRDSYRERLREQLADALGL